MSDFTVENLSARELAMLVVTGNVGPTFASDLHERTGLLVVVLADGVTLQTLDDGQLAALGLERTNPCTCGHAQRQHHGEPGRGTCMWSTNEQPWACGCPEFTAAARVCS